MAPKNRLAPRKKPSEYFMNRQVGGRGGDLVFFEDSEGVSRGVVNVQVTQGEGGKGTGGEDNVQWDRTSVVGATFGAVRVDYCETSRGGVKETIRGEEVKCHDVPPPKRPREEGNS